MKKYITGAAVALGLSTFPLAADASFSDVTMYGDEINYLTELDIIKGYDNGEFKPDNQVTRLQAVQMILRGLQVEPDGESSTEFSDVNAGDYGYDEIFAAVELGIISGKTDPETGEQYFDPYAPLTRSQMAKILTNAYVLEEEWNYFFTDISHDHWAKDYVDTLASHGISTGYEDRTFRPDQQIKRGHFALFMARMLDDRFVEGDVMEYVSYMPDPEDFEFNDEAYQEEHKFLGYAEDGSQLWEVVTTNIQEASDSFGETSTEYRKYLETADGLFMSSTDSLENLNESNINLAFPYPLNEDGTSIHSDYDFSYTSFYIREEMTINDVNYKNVVVATYHPDYSLSSPYTSSTYYAPNLGLVDRSSYWFGI
ncbi:S-layer homology domain-containing protein [Jeotgalibacillus terrae]|uniref:S-layer homology domain-containing protein n=1 Tax=Jeotgalibacillus terrae TaxID=587735 RepID=A0ABW5ZEI3_9BACL|nr:S-layer homology domain-containing protein [Jeotgalibacillus terrae]MBM7577837.1 hypothetical protein [Jeotgalibacillus terrae]